MKNVEIPEEHAVRHGPGGGEALRERRARAIKAEA